jgi:predicted acylesterase/phospholipase RssA
MWILSSLSPCKILLCYPLLFRLADENVVFVFQLTMCTIRYVSLLFVLFSAAAAAFAPGILPKMGAGLKHSQHISMCASTDSISSKVTSFDLILSSGFLCFSSHSGFLEALEDRALLADAIVGTSSGALAGALLAAGYTAADIARLLSMQRPIALVRPALPWRGLASTRKLEARMRELLPATFEELRRPLAVGVYVAGRGSPKTPLLLTSGDLPRAVAASCAVPGLFAPVRIGASRYSDGGAADRTAADAWRRWRPGRLALANLVTDLPAPALGPRDGIVPSDADVTVLRTPRARAGLLSLGDFEGERRRARAAAAQQLDAVPWLAPV